MLRKENIILCPYCNSAIEVDDKSKVTAIYCPNCNGYSHTYLYKKQKHEEELRQISKAIQDDIKQSQHSKEVLSAQNKQVKQTKQTKKTKKTELIHIRPSNEYSTAKTNINYYITSQLSSPHFIERMNTYLIHSGLPNLVDDNFYGNTQSISLYFNMNLFFDPLVYQKITKFLKPNKDLLNYGFLCWHGTSISAASSIMRNGFDPSRRCGQAYGSGEYFGSHTAVSIGYGNCLILTYVIDSRSVSRYNFGFVVNNPFNSTYCLPIAFCVLGEFSLKNMFNLPISKEAYDCEWIFGESGLIVDNLVREIFNSWSLINLGKRIEVNKNGIKHNLDYVGDLLWALTRDDCNTIVLSENDCSTMNMLFVSKPKKSVNIDFDIGSGSVDLINMTCTLANKKYLLTQFNPLDFQTI
ncbi:RWD domain-containing protein [Entamoeba marina]